MFDTSQLMAASGGGFYSTEITQSLRFNDDDSAYLSRTPSSAGNRKTWTWSGWVKRGNLGTNVKILGTSYTSISEFYLRFKTDNTLDYGSYESGGASNNFGLNTTQVFRDSSAWYHIVFAWDTTQATASDRIKMYINGTQVSSFSSSTYPSLNYDGIISTTTHTHYIGSDPTSSYFDGYLAEVNFIDGTALDATSFGEFKSGVWIPKAYSGSYGTNGFYLDFDGTYYNDKSGNGNNWTANNLASTDVVLDSPTNNFATLNPLFTNGGATQNFKEGNLKFTADGNYALANGTFGMRTGKWYWETVINSYVSVPVVGITRGTNTAGNSYVGYDPNGNVKGFGYESNGNIYGASGDGTSAGATLATGQTTYTTGDIIGCAFDADIGELKFYKNNTLIYTVSSINEYDWMPATSAYNGGINIANFGQDSSFAGNKTAQGNTDDNGIGDFYYAPPTGYLALCTANLPDPVASIDPAQDGSPQDHFNTVTYTGVGGTQSVTGVGFQPDFTWFKRRSAAAEHGWHDVVRGVSKIIGSDNTNAEIDRPTYVTSFDSDGFSFGDNVSNYNASGSTYVAWNWKANGSGVSNTDGSITSTVSANTDAGFSIVTYTGDGGNSTVGHGLNQKPEFIINKGRANLATYNQWVVHHKDLTTDYVIYLNLTDAEGYAAGVYWQEANFSDTVFGVGNDIYGPNVNGTTYVSYCFHSVAGFSKFGSYTGNGSTDGSFIYTGFRPSFLLIKRTDGAENWVIYDTARDTYNELDSVLYTNSSNAEFSGTTVNADALSNGFKLRDTWSAVNASGGTYIFMAFSSNPFKYSTAV